jgi:hypothetical protein
MRLALVTLILLCSTAAAFAETALVLWDQSVYAVEGQEPAVLTRW